MSATTTIGVDHLQMVKTLGVVQYNGSSSSSACLAHVVCSLEQQPLYPNGSLSSDGVSIIPEISS